MLAWIKIIIILYCVTGIALYYLQERLLFRPQRLTPSQPFAFSEPFREVSIRFDANTLWSMVEFLPEHDTAARGVVLYFHGNRQNINRYAPFAKNFTSHNYEVWMPDYPGYGQSTGELTEQALYDEALEVYKLARSRFQPGQIIIYGKSLGSGIAAELATKRDCRALILETPYYSIETLLRRYLFMYPLGRMLKFHLPTGEYLKNVVAPVTVLHGTDDAVVPFSNAAKLRDSFKPGDRFIAIEKGDHHNLNGSPLFHHTLDSLLR